MMTLLALAAPFCTFAQPDVSDKDGVMRQVVKIVMGWELATVGGNKIGTWQWVDTKGIMAGGGLLVSNYNWSGVEDAWDQAKKDSGAEVELGAALLV
ncbi:hypothetical protein QFC20_006360 [Naganishia adeliensis]|uniref:Uncharacterized protein n=1 Tax=Naganishia adeliensis TaxID=92952 RepID=A0ACC2VCC9_9TREE|nr:hypothetical protein QFC20_006360 [Naganishia adeliensis]